MFCQVCACLEASIVRAGPRVCRVAEIVCRIGGQPTDDPQGGGIADHAAVALGGYLYVVGGTNGTTSLASVERYSPLADKWEYMAAMSIGRW